MKKAMLMMIAMSAMALGADDKVWPANYWTVVTNQMTTATPTVTATASQAVSIAGDVASTQSSAYNQQVEARMRLSANSGNTVADFSSFPPGTIFSFR